MLGSPSIDVSIKSDKNLPDKKITVCATFKVLIVNSFYDHGDLVNKVKVKHMICNKRSCHCVSCLYLNLIYGHFSLPLVKKKTLTNKIQKMMI